jgi:hypothetical protein
MKVSRRRIQSIKKRIQSMKSMKRRIQSMKSMKSMKSKKGTRRAKSMGYKSRTSIKSIKSRKSRKSRKSSVSDNTIKTSINAIISRINSTNLSTNDKIEMISNELSKLPTINFYGSLYIPNLSSLDNEDEAIELHNGGVIDPLIKEMTRLEKKLATTKSNLEKAREKQSRNPGDEEIQNTIAELTQQQKEYSDAIEILNNHPAIKEAREHEERTQTRNAAIRESKAKEQAEKNAAEPCKNELLEPLRDLINKTGSQLETFKKTIIKIERDMVDTTKKYYDKLTSKIKDLEEKKNKFYDAEEKHNKTQRISELGYTSLTQTAVMNSLPPQGHDATWQAKNFNLTNNEREERYVTFLKEMYAEGYEDPNPSSVPEYKDIFDKIAPTKFKEHLLTKLSDKDILIETQELATSQDPGTMFWFYKKSEREANPHLKNQDYFHLTIHLGRLEFEKERYDKGKVHLVKRNDDGQSLNMRPYVFTKVEGTHKNNSGPDRCIQVIPIYNPDITQDTDLKLLIVKELNEYIWKLQITDSRKKLWEPDATEMKNLMKPYITAKLQKGSIMLRRTELKVNFIPQMLTQIEELEKFFTGRKRQFFKKCLTSSHSQEEVNKLIGECRELFTNIETRLNTENRLIVVDPNEDDLEIFKGLLGSTDKFLALEEEELNIDDVDVPNIEEILGALEKIKSELRTAIAAPVEDDEEPEEAAAETAPSSSREAPSSSRAAAEAGPSSSRAGEEKAVKTPLEKAQDAVTKAKKKLKAAEDSNENSTAILALKAVVTTNEAKLDKLRKSIRETDATVRRDLQGTPVPTTKQGKARVARTGQGKNKITKKRLNKITRKRLNKTKKRKYK